jgi:hypothetical protein
MTTATENTIGLTRMQAAAIHDAIDGRLEVTEASHEPDVLCAPGQELLVIADVLECVQKRRFPLGEDGRRLLMTLEAEAEDDLKGECAGEDDLVMLRALLIYLKVTREMVDRRAGGDA